MNECENATPLRTFLAPCSSTTLPTDPAGKETAAKRPSTARAAWVSRTLQPCEQCAKGGHHKARSQKARRERRARGVRRAALALVRGECTRIDFGQCGLEVAHKSEPPSEHLDLRLATAARLTKREAVAPRLFRAGLEGCCSRTVRALLLELRLQPRLCRGVVLR